MDGVFYILGSLLILVGFFSGLFGFADNEVVYIVMATSLIISGLLFLAIGKVLILLTEIKLVLIAGLKHDKTSNFVKEATKDHPAVSEALRQWDEIKRPNQGSGFRADRRDVVVNDNKSSGWVQFLVILAIVAAAIAWFSL